MSHHHKKRFGQHFLNDDVIIERIVSAIGANEDTTLVEIGPGEGALTRKLVQHCPRMHAIELDRDLIESLRHRFPSMTIIQSDVLKVDFTQFQPTPIRVAGNLPYNISTPIIFHLLSHHQHIDAMIFMLQKEVVDRICALPGSKQYGRLSVMTQAQCRTDYLFDVPPEAFDPPPKVDSAIVRLTPFKSAPPIQQALLERLNHVVIHAFSMRRKTLRNALKGIAQESDLKACGVDPSARAETVPVEKFIELTEHLFKDLS